MKNYFLHLNALINQSSYLKPFQSLCILSVFMFLMGCSEDDIPEPKAHYSYTASDTNPLEINFINNTTNATSYSWDFGDGTGSSETNPKHIYSDGGAYIVTLIAEGAGGKAVISNSVTVQTPAPDIDFIASINHLNVTFSVFGKHADSYLWDFGDGTTSDIKNPIHLYKYDETDTYQVTLIATGEGGTTKVSKEVIIVNPLPDANFDYHAEYNKVSFINYSTYADSYSWDFGNGDTSTERSPDYNYTSGGNFTVKLTCYGRGGEAIYTRELNITCGLEYNAFIGTYRYEPIDNGYYGVAPFGDDPYNVDVKYVANKTRSVSLDYLPQFVPGNPFEFTFDIICTEVIPYNSQNTGVGCGDPILIGTPDPEDFGIIDPNDDSVINITILDLQEDGNCGAEASPVRFKLVKN